jgi:transcriptional regulator with XRE-family HTH domain
MSSDSSYTLPKISGFRHTDDNVTNWHFLSRAKCDVLGRDISARHAADSYMAKKNEKPLTGYEKEVLRRLKEARINIGLTQGKMAELLGIERSTYTKYETIRIIDTELIPNFCKIVGVSIDFLLTGKEHPLVQAYMSASSDDKRLADKVLDVKWEYPKKTGT